MNSYQLLMIQKRGKSRKNAMTAVIEGGNIPESMEVLMHRMKEYEFDPAWIRRNQDMTDALLNGAKASEIAAARSRDCPYESKSLWAWAWRTGFDLGRRIDDGIAKLAAVVDKAEAFGWIQKKLRVAWHGYKPPTDGRDEIQEMYGNMHVVVNHANSFEKYITAFKCNDKHGEIARQNALLLWFIRKFEGESGMGASEWGQYREFRDALRAVGRVTDADMLEEEFGSPCP